MLWWEITAGNRQQVIQSFFSWLLCKGGTQICEHEYFMPGRQICKTRCGKQRWFCMWRNLIYKTRYCEWGRQFCETACWNGRRWACWLQRTGLYVSMICMSKTDQGSAKWDRDSGNKMGMVAICVSGATRGMSSMLSTGLGSEMGVMVGNLAILQLWLFFVGIFSCCICLVFSWWCSISGQSSSVILLWSLLTILQAWSSLAIQVQSLSAVSLYSSSSNSCCVLSFCYYSMLQCHLFLPLLGCTSACCFPLPFSFWMAMSSSSSWWYDEYFASCLGISTSGWSTFELNLHESCDMSMAVYERVQLTRARLEWWWTQKVRMWDEAGTEVR